MKGVVLCAVLLLAVGVNAARISYDNVDTLHADADSLDRFADDRFLESKASNATLLSVAAASRPSTQLNFSSLRCFFTQHQYDILQSIHAIIMTPESLAGLDPADAIKVLTGGEILDMSKQQLAALAILIVEAMSTDSDADFVSIFDAFHALPNATQYEIWGAITPEEVMTFAPSRVAQLKCLVIGMFTAAQVSGLTQSQVDAMAQDQFACFAPSAMAGWTVHQLGMFTCEKHLNQFSPKQISFLSVTVVAQFSPDAIRCLSVAQVGNLTTLQIRSFSKAQIQALRPAQIAALTVKQLQSLSGFQLQSFGDSITQFSPAQVASLLVEQFKSISNRQWMLLSAAQLSVLHLDVIKAIVPYGMSVLSAAQIAGFTCEQIAVFSASQLNALQTLSTFKVTCLSADQIKSVKPSLFVTFDLRQLGDDAIRALTIDQLRYLSEHGKCPIDAPAYGGSF